MPLFIKSRTRRTPRVKRVPTIKRPWQGYLRPFIVPSSCISSFGWLPRTSQLCSLLASCVIDSIPATVAPKCERDRAWCPTSPRKTIGYFERILGSRQWNWLSSMILWFAFFYVSILILRSNSTRDNKVISLWYRKICRIYSFERLFLIPRGNVSNTFTMKRIISSKVSGSWSQHFGSLITARTTKIH